MIAPTTATGDPLHPPLSPLGRGQGEGRRRRRRVSKFGVRRKASRGRRVQWLWTFLLILAVVLTAGAYTGWKRVWPLVRARPEYQASLAEVWIPKPPPWIRRDVVKEVQQLTGLPETFSLLEGDPATRLAEAFAQHPWVEQVDQVRIVRPHRVEIRLRYRRPVAMVEVPGGLLPVDALGTLLPSEDFDPTDAAAYPLLRGVPTGPVNPVGKPWEDPLVQGGAKIAAVLGPHWTSLNLEAIEGVLWSAPDGPVAGSDRGGRASRRAGAEEASASPSRPGHPTEGREPSTRGSAPPSALRSAPSGTFYLLSRGGTRVVWGRPPDTDHPGEIPASEKIARLQDYVRRFGSLEAPAGPYELDIRHWKALSRRPVSSRQ